MMKLVSMFGNWLMERFIREKMPKMAMATKIKAVVTGLLTAVRCRLMIQHLLSELSTGSGTLNFDVKAKVPEPVEGPYIILQLH